MLSLIMKFTADHYKLLQSEYFRHFPQEFPLELLMDYRSILVFRNYLKTAKPDQQLLTILLDITLQKINSKKRFQKILLLKLILHHSRCENLDSSSHVKIFEIYQRMICSEPDEVCWKLSNMIRDRELSREQLNWLLENYEQSKHILNRILRYPVKNKKVSEWAETAINNEELISRRAEIIGCILNYRSGYRHKDHDALVWGIYYSKLDDEHKKILLDKHLYPDNLVEVLKICERAGYTDLIEKWYNEITELMDGAKFLIPYGA